MAAEGGPAAVLRTRGAGCYRRGRDEGEALPMLMGSLGAPRAPMARATAHWRLVNAPLAEAVPAASVAARGNQEARQLARTHWLLRRKRDGRHVATLDASGRLRPMRGMARRDEAGIIDLVSRIGDPRREPLPLERLSAVLEQIGIPDDYGRSRGLPPVAEPASLAWGGRDRYRRALWLADGCAPAWRRMHAAAAREGIHLEAISGYRSHDYQLGILRRKLARGQRLEEILAVNAAPGYSEHHSGNALDLSTRGSPAAEECFETTAAFDWLVRRAGDFGFVLSYPRDNPHAIRYEPWHWCFRGTTPGLSD